MDFISNKAPQIMAMLAALNIRDISELFKAIPASLALPPPSVDDGLSEYEGMRWMEELAAKNTFPDFDNYLGAGAFEHHQPALTAAICAKSEFLTSYTPYQAEASQGMLQIIFEFQTAICRLTGLDAANASVYDGASACAEALLMAIRYQKKQKVLVAENIHPHYLGVIKQYLKNQPAEIELVSYLPGGRLNEEELESRLGSDVAAVLIQSPNFFGSLEEGKRVAKLAHEKGALLIQCADPLSYALFSSAAEQEADIAVGDCQPFGLHLGFGGPYAGYMACRKELIRQLPGRIVGETLDTEGRRGYVLTLQAREQHIRREKATSNICTNQALAALASLATLLWYGKKGLHKLACANYQRAAYLQKHLETIPDLQLWSSQPVFNEFVIDFKRPLDEVLPVFRKAGIEPGVSLSRFFPHLSTHVLTAVTETKNQSQLDRYIETAKRVYANHL
ncbi:MAG: aminomethyl-transferring glycine dehydrogenase subunit GcvPA [Parachlamydia sp.]|nr:aminomethyl-transferring glycine dehydrogenase subunit GcvPA [Parachlamydia sp.]